MVPLPTHHRAQSSRAGLNAAPAPGFACDLRHLYSACIFVHDAPRTLGGRNQRAVSQDQLSNDLASLRIDRTPVARERRRIPSFVIWLVILGVLAALAVFVGYPAIKSSFLTPKVAVGEVQ